MARTLGVRVDSLRYYEKLRLVSKVSRDGSGRRIYDEGDVARLRFVRRA